MGKKIAHEPPATRGVKKTVAKNTVKAVQKPDKLVHKPGACTLVGKTVQAKPGKGVNFLKQRLTKKMCELKGVTEDAGDGDSMLPEDPGLAFMQAEASRRGEEFEQARGGAESEDFSATSEGREAENTRRRFYAELRKVLAAADIIIEVLDVRDPAACRSIELERQVSAAGKRLVLLLNKIDLVPKHAVEAWIKNLRRSFPVIAFKAAQSGAHRPTHAMTSLERASDGLLRSTHAVVGADELMQLLKNYSRTGGTKNKAHISVGVVGYPNTGKSSVINSMKRHSAVEVGGRAGVTKEMQEVKLDSKITLIDSPGVVFEGTSGDPSIVLRNVVRVENVVDPVGVVDALLSKAPRKAVLQFYGMNRDFGQVREFLIHVAKTRGKLRRGSGLDLPSAARAVISDWTTGKFRYYVLPPAADAEAVAKAEEETAEVVTSLAPQLDLDSFFSGKGSKPAVLGAPQRQEAGGGGDVSMDGQEGPGHSVEVDMEA